MTLRNGLFIYSTLLVPLTIGVTFAFAFPMLNAAPGETGSAALGWLKSGTLSDPYFIPTGPTAHVSPLFEIILIVFYKVFGANSESARIGLSLFNTLLYCMGASMAVHLVRSISNSRIAVIFAIGVTCLFPLTLYEVVVYYRQWDQVLAAVILMAGLQICADPNLFKKTSYWAEATMSILAGVAGLVAPSALPSLIIGTCLVIWSRRKNDYSNRRHTPALRIFWSGLLSVAILTAFLAPWGYRNQTELGKFIVTRSNFGLELAVGNQDGAEGPTPPIATMHPHDNLPAAQRLAQIGEVAYMAEMTNLAKQWIAGHPSRFLLLTLERIRLVFLPPMSFGPNFPLIGTIPGGLLIMGLAIFKLGALVKKILTREKALMWFVFTVLPCAPYVITHVSFRYLFPVFFTSICLVCSFIDTLFVPKVFLADAPPAPHS